MPNNSAVMDVVPDGQNNKYALKFPRVTIEWTLPVDIPPMPIAINWGKLGEDCDLITLCQIRFVRGRYDWIVPKGYEFDGASIPRLIRWAPGYQRVGRHLWAATIHDWICDHPEKGASRAIGDAVFVTLLLDTGVERRQSRWMYRAVRLWSAFRAWQAGPEGEIVAKTAQEAAKAPESKAVAVRDAAAIAKEETSVPPCDGDCETK
jgi:hypothetical protein